ADGLNKVLQYAAHWDAWKWCFWIPACIAVAGALILFLGVRDEPREVGLPDLPDTGLGSYQGAKSAAARKKFEAVMVWRNRWVWTFCIANLFVYVVRMGILDWGPKFLSESRGLSIESAGWTVAAFEVAGIVGTIFAGWATDRFFNGKGHRMCVFCMLGAALFMTAFMLLPESTGLTVTALVLVGAGFCIYGPQALIGIELGNQATKEASARANGLAGILGYIGSGLSGLLVGYVADWYGWGMVFKTIIVVAFIGMLVLLTMWKAPRDGYERAASIDYNSRLDNKC
ncbi:MAG: MFS transporter, partial [Muribaculaceae bacterium]|nr:MFS transporter [Muribaculaceae bacterium]